MRRLTGSLWAVALCAAVLAGAPAEGAAAQQADVAWIDGLLLSLQRETGAAGARLEALVRHRDAARQA
ncbi:MAG: hypothetical protein ACE5JZ_08685, partial [Kiloniellales bacterium]